MKKIRINPVTRRVILPQTCGTNGFKVGQIDAVLREVFLFKPFTINTLNQILGRYKSCVFEIMERR